MREEAPLRSAGAASGDVDLERSFRDAKREVVTAFEGRYLAALMERQRGNVTAAAKEAGMLRSALQRLLRKHELKSADFRRARGGAERRTARAVETDLDAD